MIVLPNACSYIAVICFDELKGHPSMNAKYVCAYTGALERLVCVCACVGVCGSELCSTKSISFKPSPFYSGAGCLFSTSISAQAVYNAALIHFRHCDLQTQKQPPHNPEQSKHWKSAKICACTSRLSRCHKLEEVLSRSNSFIFKCMQNIVVHVMSEYSLFSPQRTFDGAKSE